MPGGAGSGGSVRGGKKIGERIRSTRFEMQTSGGNAMRGLLERKKAAAESRMEARKQAKAKADAKAAKAKAKADAKAAKTKAGGEKGKKKAPKPDAKPTKAAPKNSKKTGAAAKSDKLKAKADAKAAKAKEKAAQELKAKLQSLKAPKTTSELRQTIERGTSRAIQAALAATSGAAISMAQRSVDTTSQAVQ